MKKIINLIAAFFLIPLALFAAKKPYWKDLNVYSINANTERTELIFWSKADDALKKNLRQVKII